MIKKSIIIQNRIFREWHELQCCLTAQNYRDKKLFQMVPCATTSIWDGASSWHICVPPTSTGYYFIICGPFLVNLHSEAPYISYVTRIHVWLKKTAVWWRKYEIKVKKQCQMKRNLVVKNLRGGINFCTLTLRAIGIVSMMAGPAHMMKGYHPWFSDMNTARFLASVSCQIKKRRW